jgi:hypothetical protein
MGVTMEPTTYTVEAAVTLTRVGRHDTERDYEVRVRGRVIYRPDAADCLEVLVMESTAESELDAKELESDEVQRCHEALYSATWNAIDGVPTVTVQRAIRQRLGDDLSSAVFGRVQALVARIGWPALVALHALPDGHFLQAVLSIEAMARRAA